MAQVLVAMSGGVDSSVAAALLADAGHEVAGVTLRLWGGESDSGCCSVGDVEDARRVAAQLGVPHYAMNLGDVFERTVVQPYADAYTGGRTPNPCVECNRFVKFGVLLDRAMALGFDAIATGHHARVLFRDGRFLLTRGRDVAKDQSYVLYMLGQSELARTLLPVGELTKADVRSHAMRLGLRTATKPDSMDVCFVARGRRRDLVHARSGARPGKIVDTAGAVLGAHDGVAAFTVGQRRGLGIAAGERRYVVDIDAATGTVTVGTRGDLLRPAVKLESLTFVAGPPAPGEALDVQTSAHGVVAGGRLVGADLLLEHERPRVAPGQVVALYRGEVLVGGGVAA